MKLPRAGQLIIEREKIVEYLLNPAHPDNGGKAAFFTRLGFRRENWEKLAAALKELALTSEAVRTIESPHGKKYVLAGRILSPGGGTAAVQTIWIVDNGTDAVRLVTAYPRRK